MKKNNNYLEKVPKIPQNLDYTVENNIVTIKRENKGLYNRLAQKLFKKPVITNVDLDEFGSFVFLQVDGKKNILEIGDAVKAKFAEKANPLYERLSKFMNALELNGFITFK